MAFRGIGLLLIACGLPFGPTAFAQRYTVTDLGSLDGGITAAYGVNNAGQVVGVSYVRSGNNAVPHAFMWSQGTMRDLGLLPGTTNCWTTAINDSGTAVGVCANASTSEAFVWTADSGITALPVARASMANGINSQGDIVGESAGGAFVYSNGVVENLGPGVAAGINDQGQIVGWSSGGFRPVLWDGDGQHDLGTLDGTDTVGVARGISNDGFPVGRSTTDEPGVHAVLWNREGIENFSTLGGNFAEGVAISKNLIVGMSTTEFGDTHAFLYDHDGPGYPVDLNDLIPAGSGWVLQGAGGVNLDGQIVGWGQMNGAQHAFLLSPLREGASQQSTSIKE
jgi:probable HAF family extracellular repeat protein